MCFIYKLISLYNSALWNHQKPLWIQWNFWTTQDFSLNDFTLHDVDPDTALEENVHRFLQCNQSHVAPTDDAGFLNKKPPLSPLEVCSIAPQTYQSILEKEFTTHTFFFNGFHSVSLGQYLLFEHKKINRLLSQPPKIERIFLLLV